MHYRYGRYGEKCFELFAHLSEISRLYFDDAVFPCDIGNKSADLLLLTVGERFKVIFQYRMNGFLTERPDTVNEPSSASDGYAGFMKTYLIHITPEKSRPPKPKDG